MKQYKLKKEFLHLKAWTVVDIFKKKDEWTISITRYVISIKDWLIAEIVDSIHFVFDEYFEEITEEQNSIFNIKEWDIYYSICDDSDVESIIFENDSYDNKYIQSWNAFLTEKEAEKEVNRRKAIVNLKKYCFDNNIKYKENVSDNDFPFYIMKNKKKWFEPWSGNINDSYDWFLFLESVNDCNKIIRDCEEYLKTIFEVS